MTPTPQKPYEVDHNGSVPMAAFECDSGTIEAFEYMSLSRATLAPDNSVITLYFGPGTITIKLRALKEKTPKLEGELIEFYRAFLKHTVSWVRARNEVITSIGFEKSEEEEFANTEISE